MPGLLKRSTAAPFGNAPAPVGSPPKGGVWSQHRDVITFDQLQKFWNELSIQAREELLRLDKQTVFEQARKNLYCSRCNGLLLDGFSQIVMYGNALQQDGGGMNLSDKLCSAQQQNNNNSVELQNPSVHPWGGLATTKDGFLTLLDCFICSESLRTLQNVFDSARTREHERELLYPDACGGGGRGWISQGMANYGRYHGMRETCALHTARISCDTLVDFWSALSEETRLSLLRMKEEDFIERLMYRFDNKRFCRDCRRNVIREFKELKELKRMRREPRCNSWFCVADPTFNYEVSDDTVQADWHQSFTDTIGIYHHFEWAIGSGEGKNDILDFEDVGLHVKAQASGLNLAGLTSCFITLRAWKLDGRCTELCVKAHTFKGHQCVHRRLIIGDGFVTITKEESMRDFFEHAEEAEEEEDDDGVDKDGNELDSDGSRPQKHAKSPELAREFLLDAATVIFKEQVEKAFREGTTRQNAHSVFVCLALKLLEERLHVACKEIITLTKQNKLLEEEEKEKREEEERKERRRIKEREKKLRRKERLKGKERERARKLIESKSLDNAFPTSLNESPAVAPDEPPETPDSGDTISEPGDTYTNDSIDDYSSSQNTNSKAETFEQWFNTDGYRSFTIEHAKSLGRKLRFRKDGTLDPVYNWYDKHRSPVSSENCFQQDETGVNTHMTTSRGISCMQKLSRERFLNSSTRSCCTRFSEKLHCSNARAKDRYNLQSCSCCQQVDYRGKNGCRLRSGREVKIGNKTQISVDVPRPSYRSVKQNNGSYLPDSCVLPKANYATPCKEFRTKQIWEPLDVRKRYSESNSHPNITSMVAGRGEEIALDKCESGIQQPSSLLESVGGLCISEHSVKKDKVDSLTSSEGHEGCENSQKSGVGTVAIVEKSDCYLKTNSNEEVECHVIINGCDPVGFSSSDICSCLSEGDSSASSTSAQNVESSSTSDSEEASQHLDGRGTSVCYVSSFHKFDESPDEIYKANASGLFTGAAAGFTPDNSVETNVTGDRDRSSKLHHDYDNGQFGFSLSQQPMITVQDLHVPVFSPQNMEYYNQKSTSWPATSFNGYLQFPHLSHYVIPSPLGYGPVTNQISDFSMHYNSLQPMTSPVFCANEHSLHHLASKEFPTSSTPQTINCVELSERPSRPPTSNAACIGQNSAFECAPRSYEKSQSFSLFHFGGPMAGAAAGSSANSLSSEVKMHSKLNPQTQSCSKEEMKIEEYSLFSGGNGARFSFF